MGLVSKLLACMSVIPFFMVPFHVLQMQQAQNRIYLNSGTLMLNINESSYDDGIKGLKGQVD